MHSQALVPRLLAANDQCLVQNVLAILLGVGFISILAQIVIPLPFTPVSITGQTFGVTLISLLWGRNRAFATLVTYVSLGGLGLPLFALGLSGLAAGPTLGYLLGMTIASSWVGYLADRGFTKTFLRTWLSATSGSVIVFSFGLAGLSFFVPSEKLLALGFVPFLPGDIIKNFCASLIAHRATRLLED